MEAMIAEILDEVGGLLAEGVRGHLRTVGLPELVDIVRHDGAVIVASRSDAVRQAEVGAPDRPPGAVLETAAREVEATLVAHIARRLGNVSP